MDPTNARSSRKKGAAVGVEIRRRVCAGFPTPSRKLEFYSKTLKDWKWPEYSVPGLHQEPRPSSNIDLENGEMLLLPTFRLPTLIHTRSGNAKWLYEISNTNPLWMHPQGCAALRRRLLADLLQVRPRLAISSTRFGSPKVFVPGVDCLLASSRTLAAQEE